MSEFKDGDKVYFPKSGVKVFTVKASKGGTYSVIVDGATFTSCGRSYGCSKAPSIVHATLKNKELLEKLYGVEFEIPPPRTRTVTFEMPETFVPKIGEGYWFISPSFEGGVNYAINRAQGYDTLRIAHGVWRTKDEAMQVANAVFNLEKDE